jgi:hypothetical protein
MICLPFDAFVQTRLLLGTIKVQPLFLDVKHGAFARTRSLAFSTLHATHLLLSFFFPFKSSIIVFLRRLGCSQESLSFQSLLLPHVRQPAPSS